jgi:hypothetical protein
LRTKVAPRRKLARSNDGSYLRDFQAAEEVAVRSKREMLEELKKMLRDVFAARLDGTSHPRMARAHGYVDGYMRVLLDTGIATKQELLGLVAAERAAVCGPATADLAEEALA